MESLRVQLYRKFIGPKIEAGQKYRVYHDGNHAVVMGEDPRKKGPRRFEQSAAKELFKQLYAIANEQGLYLPKDLSIDKYSKKLPNFEIYQFVKMGFKENSVVLPPDLHEFLCSSFADKAKAMYARNQRFLGKGRMHKWTHFVTVTYDDEKIHSEEEFEKKLFQVLAHYATRYGWRAMGCPDRGQADDDHGTPGRLHWHFVMYIPEGKMMGELEEVSVYSAKAGRRRIDHVHPLFFERFGLNDFAPLTQFEIQHGDVFHYILKYIIKSNDRIFYSRGIPSYIETTVAEEWVLMAWQNYSMKYILTDNVELDYFKMGHFIYDKTKVSDELVFPEDTGQYQFAI